MLRFTVIFCPREQTIQEESTKNNTEEDVPTINITQFQHQPPSSLSSTSILCIIFQNRNNIRNSKNKPIAARITRYHTIPDREISVEESHNSNKIPQWYQLYQKSQRRCPYRCHRNLSFKVASNKLQPQTEAH